MRTSFALRHRIKVEVVLADEILNQVPLMLDTAEIVGPCQGCRRIAQCGGWPFGCSVVVHAGRGSGKLAAGMGDGAWWA
jgi:hypothetical protein